MDLLLYIRYSLHLVIQDLVRHFGSPSKFFSILSKNMKDKVRITFSFGLYAVLLLVILVIYFKSELGKLSELELLKGSKVCSY